MKRRGGACFGASPGFCSKGAVGIAFLGVFLLSIALRAATLIPPCVVKDSLSNKLRKFHAAISSSGKAEEEGIPNGYGD
jgi:hypothetical protein